jgi:4-carboxymuconolactone decarboxylase
VRRFIAMLSILFAVWCASAGEVPSSRLEILRSGSQPASKGSAANFTGEVKVESRFQRDAPARVGGATVTFQRGARTAWHTHPLGQTLIITSGSGWVQIANGPKQTMRTGDVVLIPPNAKHWHGATAQSAMTHIAVAEALNGTVVTWMEPVSDEEYTATTVEQ